MLKIKISKSYEIDPGDSDIPIGCIVRTHPIRAFAKEHVIVERCDQLDGNPVIGWSEELLGNIVALKFHKGVVTKVIRNNFIKKKNKVFKKQN